MSNNRDLKELVKEFRKAKDEAKRIVKTVSSEVRQARQELEGEQSRQG